MGGYSVFLAPIAGIIVSDYWVVKKKMLDVPALYDPHGRYRYWHGINWQGLLAFLVSISPNLPGLAYSINKNARITSGAKHLYTICWLYGFISSIIVYVTLHHFFPAKEAMVEKTIDGVEVLSERKEYSHEGSDDEKSNGDLKDISRVHELHVPNDDEIEVVKETGGKVHPLHRAGHQENAK